MPTRIISSPLTDTVVLDPGESAFVRNAGSVVTDETFGIINGPTNAMDFDVSVNGYVEADVIGVYLTGFTSSDPSGVSTISVGASGTVVGQAALAIAYVEMSRIDVAGTVSGSISGIEVVSSHSEIDILGSVSGERFGVLLSGSDQEYLNDIKNSGTITSTNGIGIALTSSAGGTIRNLGLIDGYSGIDAASDGAVSILNSGIIPANFSSGIIFGTWAGSPEPGYVRNSGSITADGAGISLRGSGGDIVNSGEIVAKTGVFTDGDSDLTLFLRNTGLISGEERSIDSYETILDIHNSATMLGHIVSEGQTADRIANSGSIVGDVTLGGEADFYNGSGTGTVSGAVYGGTDDDVLLGSDQSDRLYGEFDDDVLVGRGGADRLNGGHGNDTLSGGVGDDVMIGGGQDDTLRGGDGNDDLNGGGRRDTLFGGRGNDAMVGGVGGDLLTGGNGNDVLEGGDGADILTGGRGRDTLDGGAQGDRLVGNAGHDILTGGAGLDVFVFGPGGDTDVITDFTDNQDTLELDQHLWSGTKTVEQVLAQYASVIGGDTVFEFGNGNTLTLQGVTDVSILADDMVLV